MSKLIQIALLITSYLAISQPASAASPQFEVASIKQSNPSEPGPGRLGTVPVVATPGRLTARNATLRDLIKGTYALEDYQVLGGPGWLVSARFDVEGKPAGTADRDTLLLMLRALLADRFKLVVHPETKELAIYALVVAKNGPKFQALPASQASCWPGCAGLSGKMNHLRQRDLPSLARFLTHLAGDRPVIDKTALSGSFGLELDMERIMAAAEQSGGPPTNERIYEAAVDDVQDELGLKLVPAKAPVEVLIIDHVEKPSEN